MPTLVESQEHPSPFWLKMRCFYWTLTRPSTGFHRRTSRLAQISLRITCVIVKSLAWLLQVFLAFPEIIAVYFGFSLKSLRIPCWVLACFFCVFHVGKKAELRFLAEVPAKLANARLAVIFGCPLCLTVLDGAKFGRVPHRTRAIVAVRAVEKVFKPQMFSQKDAASDIRKRSVS